MGKDKYKRPSHSVLQNLYNAAGQVQTRQGGRYTSVPNFVDDDDLTSIVNEQRFVNAEDVLGSLLEGRLSSFEEEHGIDLFEQVVQDEDGEFRNYRMIRDANGNVRKAGLVNEIEGITLGELGFEGRNPYYDEHLKRKMFSAMAKDIDPDTGQFKENIGKSFLENALLNSMTAQFGVLGARIFGGKNLGKYGTFDPVLNKLDFKEDGNITYDGKNLGFSDKEKEIFAQWFDKKVSFQSSGFTETFANIATTFAIDMPLFVASGRVGGMVLNKTVPSLMKAHTIPTKFAQHLANNMMMLSLASSAGTINHTLEGGIDAFLEDIKHNAEFAVMASVFGMAGESLGKLGISKLLRKAAPLDDASIVAFLKRNPKVVQTLSGGLTSGGLGYTVTEGTEEEKLATGLTFMAMHFSHPSAWKNYIKGKGANVMVERDAFNDILREVRGGKNLFEAIRELKATEPRYVLREGEYVYEINGYSFTTRGIIEKITDSGVKLTPETVGNYQYITEAAPFVKKLFSQALRDERIVRIKDKVLKENFKDVVNPFEKGTEQYENFEYNKDLAATQLSMMLYGNDLYKTIKRNGLPQDYNLNKFIAEISEALQFNPRVFQQFAMDNIVPYLKDPKGWSKENLKFLPEEYRKSFESVLDYTEKALKRFANAEMMKDIINRRKRLDMIGLAGAKSTVKVAETETYKDAKGVEHTRQKEVTSPDLLNEQQVRELIDKLQPARDLVDIYDALERYTPSNVFEALKRLGKGTEAQEFRDKVQGAKESGREKELNEIAVKEQITRDFGTYYAETLLDMLTPKERQFIGESGTYPEGLKETLNQIHKELMAERARPIETTRGEKLPGKAEEPITFPREAFIEGKPVKIVKEHKKFKRGSIEHLPTSVIEKLAEGQNATVEEARRELYTTGIERVYETSTGEIFRPENVVFRDVNTAETSEARRTLMTDLSTKPMEGESAILREMIDFLKPALEKRKVTTTIEGFRELLDTRINELPKESEHRQALERVRKHTESWRHLWELADRIGLNIKSEETPGAYGSYDRDGSILISKRFGRESGWFNDVGKFLETVAHEVMHGILHSKYKGSTYNYHRDLAPLLRQFRTDLHNYVLTDKAALDALRKVLDPVLMDRLDYALNNQGSGWSPQELVTIFFTNAKAAQWLDNIPFEGIKTERPQSFFQYLKKVILDWVGKTQRLPKSALDELTEIIDQSLLERGADLRIDKIKEIEPSGRTIPDYASERGHLVSELSGIRAVSSVRNVPEKIDSKGSNVSAIERKIEGDTKLLADKIEPVKTPINDLGANKNRSPIEGKAPESLSTAPKIPEAIKNEMPEAKTRKVEKVENITERAKVQEARESETKSSVMDGKVMKNGKLQSLLGFQNEKLQQHVFENNKLLNLSRGIKTYIYQSLVPVFRKDTSVKFRDLVYQPGEEMIRYSAFDFNTIMRRIDGWNEGIAWRDFTQMDRRTGELKNPKAVDFLNAIKDYEFAQYNKMMDRQLTWKEFADWAKFDPEQRKILDIYEKTTKAFIGKRKELLKRFIVDLDKNILDHVKEKDFKEFGLEGKSPEEVKQFLAENKAIREKIAEKAVESKYKDWGKYMYYNAVRPVTPNTILVEFSKENPAFTTKKQAEAGEIGKERISTYYENLTEARQGIQDLINKGWVKESEIILKDIIKPGGEWAKLNAHQLIDLAMEGHIPLSDPVLQKLLDATRTGIDLHGIHKDFVPGMKYSAKEFETQLERLGREAVIGSWKTYGLTKVRENLNTWQAELNEIISQLSHIKTGSVDKVTIDKLRQEFMYAQGYYNQLRAPERTVIDKIRGVTFSWYTGGLKPSFIFQQALQNLQTGMHLAAAELKTAGLGGVPDAIKMLADASGKAIEVGFALRAEKLGKDIGGFRVDVDALQTIKDLELMGKIRAVGVKELTGQAGETNYYYDRGTSRAIESMIKWSNATTAMVEKYTRVQSALMFNEIAKMRGMEGKQKLEWVADKIDKAMIEFGKGGRAPFFDSKSAIPNQGTIVNAMKKAFLTYKSFSFYNYGLYAHLLQNKQWGALSSKIMAGVGMSGIKNLPFMASLFALAQLFSDEDLDYKTMELADRLDEAMPIPVGKILDGGVGAIAGLNTRNLLGEDTPFITDLWANAWSKSWEGKALEITLGAPFGLTKDFVDGSEALYQNILNFIEGDPLITDTDRARLRKRMYKATPVFMRNVVESMDWNKDGVMYRNGQLVAREDLSTEDIVYKLLSFSPEKVNRAYMEIDNSPDAQIRKQQYIISEAKKFQKERRDDKNMMPEHKREVIKKADDAILEAKKKINQLLKEKKEKKK